MIKKHLRLLIFTSVVILLPVLAGIILWDRLPPLIPSHWNMNGEVDGWSSKTMAVFGMPLILLAVHWFSAFVTLSDPKRKNHSRKILNLVFWIVPVLNGFLSIITYFAALGKDAPVWILLSFFMGLLFVVIGNYLPKCRQNYTIGYKIPWTLASEENWNRTHRFAGFLWVIGGILIAVCGVFSAPWLVLTLGFMMALIPVGYSYLLHRKGI